MWTWGPECFEPGGVAHVRGLFAVTGRLGAGVRVLVLSIERSGGAVAAPFHHHRVPARDVQATAMAIAELPVVEDRDLPS